MLSGIDVGAPSKKELDALRKPGPSCARGGMSLFRNTSFEGLLAGCNAFGQVARLTAPSTVYSHDLKGRIQQRGYLVHGLSCVLTVTLVWVGAGAGGARGSNCKNIGLPLPRKPVVDGSPELRRVLRIPNQRARALEVVLVRDQQYGRSLGHVFDDLEQLLNTANNVIRKLAILPEPTPLASRKRDAVYDNDHEICLVVLCAYEIAGPQRSCPGRHAATKQPYLVQRRRSYPTFRVEETQVATVEVVHMARAKPFGSLPLGWPSDSRTTAATV